MDESEFLDMLTKLLNRYGENMSTGKNVICCIDLGSMVLEVIMSLN